MVWKKTLARVLRGTSDDSLRFDEVRSLRKHLGFEERMRGGHHIFTRGEVEEILNLQPRGAMAKAYQVKQVRDVIARYRLAKDNNAS